MSNLAGMGTVPDRHSAPRGFPGRRINVAGPESRLPAVNPGRCRSKGPTAQSYAAFDSGIGIMSQEYFLRIIEVQKKGYRMCDSPFSVGCAHVGRPLRNMYDVPISLLEEPSKCAANYKTKGPRTMAEAFV